MKRVGARTYLGRGRKYLICLGVIYLSLTLYIEIKWSAIIKRPTTQDFIDLEISKSFFERINASNKIDAKAKYMSNDNVDNNTVSYCRWYPPKLRGKLATKNMFQDLSWEEIKSRNLDLSPSGSYSPLGCKARYRVAIIIPLRNRDTQLRILLSHMHPIWKRQEIAYQVYIITQVEGTLFNRAKLFNVGVTEASKDGPYDCYVFHDVDMLLEDDRCLYWCHNSNPRHLSMYTDKFHFKPKTYKLLCKQDKDDESFHNMVLRSIFGSDNIMYFGGVSMLTGDQFKAVNGFSNLYWGWGGEDDDMYLRLTSRGYSVENPYNEKCSYRMIPHKHEAGNSKNKGRDALLRRASNRMVIEGLNTLRYRLISREDRQLYTNITVDLGRPSNKMMSFLSKSFPLFRRCFSTLPWEK